MSKKSKARHRARHNKLEVNETVSNIVQYIMEKTKLNGEWKEVEVSCPKCSESGFVYAFEDKKTFFCMACSREFSLDDIDVANELEVELEPEETHCYLSDEFASIAKEADKQINKSISQMKLPGTSIGEKMAKKTGIVKGFVGYESYGSFKSCFHSPQHMIASRDSTWGVWAGKKDDVKDHAKEYDVVLNLTWTSIKQINRIPIPELKEFENYQAEYKEIQLDWPDYGVTNLPRAFWEKLGKYLIDNKYRMLIFCQGGHGRTGTAVACLMVTMLKFTAQEAIQWIRHNYCSSAIETTGQEAYIKRIAAAGENVKIATVGE